MFILHDSFGFPSDLTRILCEEIGFTADLEDFGKHMQEQRERSRAEAKFYKFDLDSSVWLELNSPNSELLKKFTGYTVQLEVEIPKENIKKIRQLKNKYFEFVIANTPFYPEGGGQVSDKGCFIIEYNGTRHEFEVIDVRKTPAEIIHVLQYEFNTEEELNSFYQNLPQAKCTAQIDAASRHATSRNHTATHLMHKALQVVLGDNVRQAGSLVNSHVLRFDFSHGKAMTKAEIEEVEFLVNQEILKNVLVKTHENVPIEKAKSMGAMAMFDEKYDDHVRVLEVPGFSLELCGGTHVNATGEIGLFKIISEGSVTSGVRRIEAVTGLNSLEYLKKLKAQIVETAENLKCAENDIQVKIHSLKEGMKNSEHIIEKLQSKLANYKVEELFSAVKIIADVKIISKVLEYSNLKEMEILCDKLKEKDSVVSILGCVADGKCQVICSISKNLLAKYKNLSAGNTIKYICEQIDGKGGGRPDFAKGGGTAADKLPEVLEKNILEFLNRCL